MSTTPPNLATTPPEAKFELSKLWTLKKRLQWTGWLQYVLLLAVAALVAILAGGLALLGATLVLVYGLWLLAGLLVLFVAYDFATVRLGLHPVEKLPVARDGLDAFELMRARVSCRSFQQRQLTQPHRAEVERLARFHSRPENRLTRTPIRLEHLIAPLKVWPVVGAQEFLVAIAPRAYDEAAVVDIGYALQNVVMGATRLGLATCWIGPGAQPGSVAAELGERFDADADHVICVCALGYASKYKPLALRVMQKQQRVRLPLSQLFFQDEAFSRPIDPTTQPYDELARSYEVCQWAPSSYNSQTTRAAVLTQAGRVARVDFASTTKSRYYAMVALGIWVSNWMRATQALGIEGRATLAPAEDPRRQSLPRWVASWQRRA